MSRLLQEQLQSVDIKNGSVSAKLAIPKGTKFGPFVGKFSTEPLDRRFAWEVSFPKMIYVDILKIYPTFEQYYNIYLKVSSVCLYD